MITWIIRKDGVKQRFRVNPKNLDLLLKKHGSRVQFDTLRWAISSKDSVG